MNSLNLAARAGTLNKQAAYSQKKLTDKLKNKMASSIGAHPSNMNLA